MRVPREDVFDGFQIGWEFFILTCWLIGEPSALSSQPAGQARVKSEAALFSTTVLPRRDCRGGLAQEKFQCFRIHRARERRMEFVSIPRRASTPQRRRSYDRRLCEWLRELRRGERFPFHR